jgi:hypothetical protein
VSDFLNSLKADLLDRRMLPLLIALSLAMAGAVAYAVLGGGSTPAQSLAANPPAAGAVGIAVNQAPTNPAKATAETVVGTAQQRGGFAHNPFTPLPTPAVKAAAAPATSKTSSSSTSTSSTKSTSPTSESTTPVKPSPPAKPMTLYHVEVLFGVVPTGAPALSTQLTAHENLKLLTPLPSKKQAVAVFRGVTAGGKSATFTLVGEVIIRGNATCLPSTTQCEVIDLKPGQYEQLEVLQANGQAITYELHLVTIAPTKASTASVRSLLGNRSKAGFELLRHAGLLSLPGMRYSATAGVLVFDRPRASGARAHVALQRPRSGR